MRFLLVVASVLLAAAGARAEDNESCLKCHTDHDALVKALKGKARDVAPLLLDRKYWERSVHGKRSCEDCHFDYDSQPHGDDAETAECGECHEKEAEQHKESLHGQSLKRGDEHAPRCQDCHGVHDILSHKDPTSPTAVLNIPGLCGKCHHEGSEVSLQHDIPQDRIFERYSQSIHGEGLYKKGLSVTAVCTSCHTSHFILPHTDKRSSIHRDNVAKTCAACHSQIEQVHKQVIEGRLWEEEPHKLPACVECHSPHKIRRAYGGDRGMPKGMKDKDCLECHDKDVDEVAFSLSAHKETACAQCHADVKSSLTRPCETIKSKVDCSTCHAEVVEEYRSSMHGRNHAVGDSDAPTCFDCHGKHAVMSKRIPTSPTFPRNVPQLCGRCHREGGQAAVRIDADVDDIVDSYTDSIHGKGLVKSGLVVTATCVNCHTAHSERRPSDPESSIHHDNVADTCGECHHGIEEEFKKSIHWPVGDDDPHELPSCRDCHTSHTISRTDQGDFRLKMMDQCGRCHEEQAETYFDTFHGKVSRLGGERSAKCYDCHGTHNILPTSNPDSTLSRDHVVETCGKCHEGSHRQFAGYLTHATHHDKDTYPWLFWTFWLMTGLLVGTLAFALLHTVAWLIRLRLSRDEWQAHKALAAAQPKQKLFRRFNRFQRGLHIFMMISFFTLALTGMALKFSYMGWARGISYVLGGFEGMGLLHRMGAITLFVVFCLHIHDVRKKKKKSGRTWLEMIKAPDSIVFNGRDLKEFGQSVKWFFGKGPRPKYGRYTYWEKFDYFAVFWGVAVIGLTGLILWFPELFTHIVPGWFVNVATIIHSDEALLAVGFIFTIHFFNTHFRPDKFPMDPVIFTGRVTVDELKFDKPAEYEYLVEKGELEEHLVDAFPTGVERGLRVFGFIALGIGLTLIALIVYTMLFGYR